MTKLAFQDTCVGSATGDHTPLHWPTRPVVSLTLVGVATHEDAGVVWVVHVVLGHVAPLGW